MYYYLDENGHISMTNSGSELPADVVVGSPFDLPEDPRDLPLASDEELEQRDESLSLGSPSFDASAGDVSGGDVSSVYVSEPFDYDALYDGFRSSVDYALVNGFEIYPNEKAISVFEDVLNGLDGHWGYVALSGNDTYSTYLYASRSYDVSGSSVTLRGDVLRCYYHQFRNSSSQPWRYTYTVSHVGDQTFSPTSELVYTNLLDGYPDLVPYKSRETYLYLVFFLILVGLIVIYVRFFRKG